MKVKIEIESADDLEKVTMDFRYKHQKVVVKEVKVNSESGSSESITTSTQTETVKGHGFDSNMMDIVNS